MFTQSFKEEIQTARVRYEAAQQAYLDGNISLDEFYKVKQEWKKVSASISKATSANRRKIESDLRAKYGESRYAQSLK